MDPGELEKTLSPNSISHKKGLAIFPF